MADSTEWPEAKGKPIRFGLRTKGLKSLLVSLLRSRVLSAGRAECHPGASEN